DWLNKGLVDPKWQEYVTNIEIGAEAFDTKFAFIQATSNGAAEHNRGPGQLFDQSPNSPYGWLPVTKPTLTRGQTIHLGDETSRTAASAIVISQKCKNIPLAVTWCDWKYSDDGVFLNTFGVEGVSFTYDANGEPQLTDLVAKNPLESLTMLALIYMQNTFTDPGMKLSYGQWQFEGSEVPDAFDEWADVKYDGAYTWPSNITFTPDQQTAINLVATDVRTFVTERFTMFVSGETKFSEWDKYIAEIESVGVASIKNTYQAAYDTWREANPA
ncbi:MAG: hypothetical protein LBC65_05055, partial [Oscillospiraceae bacterium]|nr:hypothetical protein [Oscillospiraceae bacterium]